MSAATVATTATATGWPFANDERGLQNLQAIALRSDELRQRSGRQELDEHLVNQYLRR